MVSAIQNNMGQATCIWYFRARYFDNEMGRFISRDPLGYVDGMGLYNGYFAERYELDPSGNYPTCLTFTATCVTAGPLCWVLLPVVRVAGVAIYTFSDCDQQTRRKSCETICLDIFVEEINWCAETYPSTSRLNKRLQDM